MSAFQPTTTNSTLGTTMGKDNQQEVASGEEGGGAVRIEGYLTKRTVRTGRNWKRRYFLLDNTTLWYFKSKGDARPRGEIAISPYATITASALRDNGIEIANGRHVLVVSTDTRKEFEEWMTALKKAVKLAGKNSPGGEDMEIEETKSNSGKGLFKRFSMGNLRKGSDESAASSVASGVASKPNAKNKKRETHVFTTPAAKFEVDKKYTYLRPIGTGAYGVVVSANNTETGEKVAIKKVARAFEDLVDAKRVVREIKLLLFFQQHENIIHIKDLLPPKARDKFEDIYIISELMETDLHRVIYSKQKLSEDHIQYFVYQILRALKYIHSANVIHRDLKPSNLLVNSNCDLKVCDFGLARGLQDSSLELTEYVVTRWYRAPEIMLACKEYSKAIDVWSVGCIFAELLGRKPLFPGEDYIHQLQLITETLGTPSEADIHFITSEKAKRFMRNLPLKRKRTFPRIYPKSSPEAVDLLEKMLTFDPDKRISVEEALKHPFMATLHHPDDEPVHTSVFRFDDEKPDEELKKSELQDEVLQQIFHFHPEERERLQGGGGASHTNGAISDNRRLSRGYLNFLNKT